MTKNISLLSFDLDDTLWPLRPVLENADQQTRDWVSQNYPDLHDDYHAHLAAGLPEVDHHGNQIHQVSLRRKVLLNNVARQSQMSLFDQQQFVENAYAVFYRERQKVSLFDGVTNVLNELNSHFRVVVLTNGNANVETIGIGHFFEATFSADDFHVAKPNPAIFEWICEESRVTPSQVIHIGDSIKYDITPAKKLGMKTIWYQHDEHGLDCHEDADAIAHSWAELKQQVERLCR